MPKTTSGGFPQVTPGRIKEIKEKLIEDYQIQFVKGSYRNSCWIFKRNSWQFLEGTLWALPERTPEENLKNPEKFQRENQKVFH